MQFGVLGVIISTFFQLLEILILIRMVMSWVPVPDNNITRPIINFVYDVTEPILKLVRSVIPPIMIGGMGWDLSPLLAILLLRIVRTILLSAMGLFM